MGTALITGATAGIGRAFAYDVARRGMNVVLVARNYDRLHALAESLRSEFGVTAEVLVADLTHRQAVDEVACRAAASDVELVVNNAGFGIRQEFTGGTLQDEQELLDVLVVAVMRITHAALPGMVERNRGGVINVSSVASWLASGTYSAAKAWVTTFSETLATQLKDSQVHVMALCPGFTRTEFHERANMETDTIPDWMWLDVDAVVKTALDDFTSSKPVSVPGAQYKALGLAAQYLPRPLVRVISVMQGKSR